MSEIRHYGVKGMKWGVRRAELNKPNPNYSSAARDKDRRNNLGGSGSGGVNRINRRMNKGQDLATARKNEAVFRKRRKKVVSAAVFGVKYRRQIAEGARVLKVLGSLALGVAVQAVAKRAETNRGRAAAANAFGLPQNASTGPSASKQNRKGVYNITSL